MFSKDILIKTIISSGLLLSIAGCQSAPKAQLTSLTPKNAITEVSLIQEQAQNQQADLLAYESYKNGMDKLADAKEQADKNAEDSLESASIAKAYFQKSIEVTASHQNFSPPILQAREAATIAGVKNSPELKKTLARVDDQVRDETNNFKKELKLEDFSEIQKAYLNLEISAIEYTQLNGVRAIIKSAESKNAEERAPQTLSTAKLNEESATNLVRQNPHNPDLYSQSVSKAKASALLLGDVMNKVSEMGAKTSERMALSLVMKDRKIGKLNSNLSEMEASLDNSRADAQMLMGSVADSNAQLDAQGKRLDQKNSELNDASQKVSFQQAIENARSSFSEEEADAYQQGDKLVIRLKKMNFASGSKQIPEDSKRVLSRVTEVIQSLDTDKIVIEGHTDTTGPVAFNQKLSTERAQSVADYLRSQEQDLNIESIGLGEARPIATNATQEGRATNRRVDIVISAQE